MTPTTEEARRVIAELEGRLAAASAREIELATEGRRLAFAAETGDAASKKALSKFDEEAFAIDRNRKTLGHAIDEAKRRLAAAERDEERSRLAENADRAVVLGEKLAERGRKIDEALAVVAAEATAYAEDIASLNRLGAMNPRVEQFATLGSLAVSTALMQTPLKIRHLGFGEKHSLSELSVAWRDSVARWASPFLKREAA